MHEKSKNLNIAVIPIDNRPVCYDLIEDVLGFNKNINLFMPDKNLLGSLNSHANILDILNWVDKLEKTDYLIISLDTISYGGLISSRKGNESFKEIKENIDRLFDILKNKPVKIFAFSSVLRISNSNVNEEEKEYWDSWGKKIFEYSHLVSKGQKENLPEIPKEVLEDYLATRKRNFDINKYYRKLQKQSQIDYLMFSKDDTAKYGFNIDEAQELKKLGAIVKTGADEVPLALISRALVDFYNESIGFNIVYSKESSKNIVSRYEDLTIETSVKSQVDTAKCKEGKDLTLFLNCPDKIQDDLALNIYEDKKEESIPPANTDIIADIACANGCDKVFMEELLAQKNDFIGFSGWNTTSNSIGSAIFMGIVAYFAKKYDGFDKTVFDRALQKRFLDDFIYQSIVRREMRNYNNEQCSKKLNELMKKYSKKYFPDFDLSNADFYFPCKRTFEIGIDLG